MGLIRLRGGLVVGGKLIVTGTDFIIVVGIAVVGTVVVLAVGGG